MILLQELCQYREEIRNHSNLLIYKHIHQSVQSSFQHEADSLLRNIGAHTKFRILARTLRCVVQSYRNTHFRECWNALLWRHPVFYINCWAYLLWYTYFHTYAPFLKNHCTPSFFFRGIDHLLLWYTSDHSAHFHYCVAYYVLRTLLSDLLAV